MIAASSTIHETEGARLRLVTRSVPDQDGHLDGALEIMLKPGWKTYWREPGESGVPPSIMPSGIAHSAEIHFPPPKRIEDGYASWAGYDGPVSLPLRFTLKPGRQSGFIEADVFLGICETVCIPVSARLVVPDVGLATNPTDEAAVSAAFAALPRAAGEREGVVDILLAGDELILSVAGKGTAELFLAPTKGWRLGTPEPEVTADGGLRFRVSVLKRPQKSPATVIDYVLSEQGKESLAGRFLLP
jgi:DsbC/DsbD-like thiol-disulfide interchange protein